MSHRLETTRLGRLSSTKPEPNVFSWKNWPGWRADFEKKKKKTPAAVTHISEQKAGMEQRAQKVCSHIFH